MKSLIIIIGLLNVCVGVYADHPENNTPARKKTRVAVVGFDKGNLLSNYYMDDSISKFTQVPIDSLHRSFSRAILAGFKPITSSRIEVIPVEFDHMVEQFISKVTYNGTGDSRRVDFSEAPINELLDGYNADYLVYISQCEINCILSPYKTYYYIVKYTVLNDASERMHDGRVFFENTEIVPLRFLTRKHEKQAQKIISQTEKLLSDR